MQSLSSYISARCYFQGRKDRLKMGELQDLLDQVKGIRKTAIFKNEKNEIDELALDIECLVEEIKAKEEEIKAKECENVPEKEAEEHSKIVAPSLYLNINVLDFSSGNLFREAERELISQALEYFGGNRTKTALGLGISIRCLRNKINEFKGEHDGTIH